MSTPSVIIQEFEVAYNVPRTMREFSSVRDRLDHILVDEFERAWDRCVLNGEAQESYCFIDRLEFSFSLDLAAWDDHTIARRWAVRLYDALEKKIKSGTGVVFFEDRAHYLAAFLCALLQGTAAGDPCFRDLISFTASESATAMVQLLSAEPDTGRDALLLLTKAGYLPLFLARLTDEAIERLWSICIAPASRAPVFTASYPIWVRRLLVFLNDFFLSGQGESRDLISLHLEFIRANPDLGPDTNLAVFHRDLIRLRYSSSPSGAAGRIAPVLPDSHSEAFLQRLTARIDETDIASLLRLLFASRPARTHGVFSRCAGLFLLLPTIAEFRFHDFSASLQFSVASANVSLPAVIRYLLGLQLLGPRRDQFSKDPGLLLFSGLPEAPDWFAIQDCADSLIPAFHDFFLAWIAKSEERLRRELHYRDAFRKRHSPDDLSSLPSGESPSRSSGLFLLDRTVAAFANAVLREFTARLGSFSESSVDFLVRNFFALTGEIADQPQAVTVTLATCPLQSLLRLTGFTASETSIPELANRPLHFVFPEV
jgi:hypothetical protein